MTFLCLAADYQEQLAIQASVESEIMWGENEEVIEF